MTPKQQRFCQEYVIDLNGAQAAIRAGYSPKTARSISNENLTKPYIQAEIQQVQAEIADRLEVTTCEVIRGLRDIAVNGQSESARVRAYELLGKHQGMFTDRLAVTEQKPEAQFVFYWPHNGRD